MKKQKLFSILSLLGLFYIIWLGVSYLMIEKVEPATIVKVPQEFVSQFGKVTTKKRPQKIEDIEFVDGEGRTTSFSAFEGKHLLVNFWATWCAPCVVELPSFERLGKKLKSDNIEIIAISLDMQRSQKEIKTFLENRTIGSFASYLDEKQYIQKNIRMRGIPTSFLISPSGEVTHIFEGDADWASPSAVGFFNSVLNNK